MRISDWSSDVCSSDLDPALLGLRVAAGGRAFFEHRAVGGLEAAINFREFLIVFGLDAEMLNALCGVVARRNGEIHARIVEHPLGIVVLSYGGLDIEQGGIEGDGAVDVFDANVHVQTLHRSEEHTSELQSLMRISYAV